MPGSRLVAVASRDPNRAREVAAAAPYDVAVGSRTDVLARDDVDVVWVTSIHPAHDDDSRAALGAGKAVLCEKPLTMSAADSAALQAAALDAGRLLVEAVWTRFHPLVRRVVDLVRSGAVGRLAHVAADFSIARPEDPHHRIFDPDLGGSALLDLGIYPVTWAHLLLGEPATVDAAGRLAATGVDATASLLLGWPGGESAVLTCSATGLGDLRVRIVGSQGRIDVDPPLTDPPGATWSRSDGSVERLTAPDALPRYQPQVAEVARCVREGRLECPVVTAEDTLAVARTLDRALDRLGVATGPTVPLG